VTAAANARRASALPGLIGLAAVAAATFAFRWLSLADFKNDHFDHVARAYQVLLGDWPVRDFVDPGMPLTYLVSAAAIEALDGRVFLAETLLFATAFALAAALSWRCSMQASGSAAIATLCAALQVAAVPRSYSYPKLLVYATAIAVGWWVVDRRKRAAEEGREGPGALRLVALAAVTALGYYFRHDHGIYVGAGAVVLLTVHLWGRFDVLRRALLLYTAATAAFVLPHLVYVQLQGGLATYLAIARDYGRMEAQTNPLTVPWFSLPLDGNAIPFLFWSSWIMPLVSTALLLRGVAASRSESARIAMVIALAVCVNVGFVRDTLAVRLPDAAVPHTILGAWLLGVLWRWPAGTGARTAARVLAAGASAAAVIAVFTAFETLDHVERTRISGGLYTAADRWQDVADQLERDAPDLLPSHVLSMMPFFDYVRRCTAAGDRLLYVGYQPEVFVVARRGFAGGHLMFASRFHATPLEQALALERLRVQRVPFVLLPAARRVEFRESYADVWRHVDTNYVPMTVISTDAGPLEILIHRNTAARGSMGESTGWPCPV
jgi:hypothetical protein